MGPRNHDISHGLFLEGTGAVLAAAIGAPGTAIRLVVRITHSS